MNAKILSRLSEVEQTGTDILSVMEREHLDIDPLFQKISRQDYSLMLLLGQCAEVPGSGKVYLSDIAKRMELSTRAVSELASSLRKKGMVQWLRDGKGTYLQLDNCYTDAVSEQSNLLKDVYSSVISAYGEERYRALMQETAALRLIVENEIAQMKPQAG